MSSIQVLSEGLCNDRRLVALDKDGVCLDHHRIQVMGAGSRSRVDGRAVAGWLRLLQEDALAPLMLVAERVSSMPTDGVAAAFAFAKATGAVIGIAEALGARIVEVAPTDWQKLMLRGHKRTPKAVRKANCALVASDLFPELAQLLRVKANWGLADAALIGEYHRRMNLRGQR